MLQFRNFIGLLLLIILPLYSYAETYVAIQSGDWNNPLVWGGNAPSTSIEGEDMIIIASGIEVFSENRITVNNPLATVNLNGSLRVFGELTVESGTIIGTGQLIVATLQAKADALILLAGELVCDDFINESDLLFISSNTQINSSLQLLAGLCTFDSDVKLMLSQDVDIHIAGGKLIVMSPQVITENKVNIIYSGEAEESGSELYISSISSVVIDMDEVQDSLSINSDFVVQDSLVVLQGVLNLGDVNLVSNGLFKSSISGSVNVSGSSSISLHGESDIYFNASADTLSNIYIACDTSEFVRLYSNLFIQDSINLESGILALLDCELGFNTSCNIHGGSKESFINLSTNSNVRATIGAESNLYLPIGQDSNYFPCEIANNLESDTELILELSAIVYSEGEEGESLNLTDKIIGNTWFISNADVNADVDLDLRLYWESSASLNGFDSDNCYISHYTNGAWDIYSSTMAQVGADGMFSVSREGIRSLSPFKVREGINSSLNEVYNNNSIKVWPVPASNLLNIESQSNIKDILVFDLESKLHIQEDGQDQNRKTIDLTYLLPGTYIVQVNGTIAQRIIINR